ncbi:hypothetical protein BV326_04097 [Pseudomonas syringae pv. actinidiae]|nr:hypothetical protein BV326_04097 [Pseudomonas syringae pv. actinidiae]
MTKKYRKFDAAFKLDVCKLIVDQGQSVNSVCLDMNLSDTAVRRWVEQYKAELLGGPGIGKPLTNEQQRIRQLEQQIREYQIFCVRAGWGLPLGRPLGRPLLYQLGLVNRSP